MTGEKPRRLRLCLYCDDYYPEGSYGEHRHWHIQSPNYIPTHRGQSAGAANPEREAAMVAAWRSGRTGKDIAREYGISRERVRQLLVRAGIASLRHPLAPKPDPVCRFCGVPYQGLFLAHCRAARHRAGARTSPELADRTLRMAEAYRNGEDATEIAARFGVKRVTVYKAARRAGIVSRVRSDYGPRVHLDAIAALSAGLPNWEVAERYGLTAQKVASLKSIYVTPRERQAVSL